MLRINMDDKEAKERVAEIKGFYMHLVVYVVINLFLFWVNKSQGGYIWFYWSLFGWGIGIVLHAVSVFLLGKDWEERKVKKITRR